MVVVKAGQGTLSADGSGLCSACPAGNTGHGGSRLRADSTTTRKEGRRKTEEGRRKTAEGRRKKEGGRRQLT